jgi:hypothetical protein
MINPDMIKHEPPRHKEHQETPTRRYGLRQRIPEFISDEVGDAST